MLRRIAGKRFAKPSGSLARFINYQSQYAQAYQIPRRTWPKKLAITLGVLSVGLGAGYYFYWPKHTFPTTVAAILRKGLWAESDKGEFDFQLALKYYLAALDECHEQNVSRLSDEYTGIQLKIAEMYERMNMTENSLSIYSEISAAYMIALTSHGIPEDRRPHIIQKDLRLVIKMAELHKGDPAITKAMLMTHLMVAQEEVAKRSGKLGERILHQQNYNSAANPEQFEDQGDSSFAATSSDSEIVLTNADETITAYKNPQAWLPFRDELFNARDLFVAICLSLGDIEMAVRSKLISTEWMILAECDLPEILMATCNLGSLMYLLAERSESQEAILRKLQTEKRPEFSVLELAEAVKNRAYTLGEAKKCYTSVLANAKMIPTNERYNTLDEAIGLATYGLGVIHLHAGEYAEARQMLRQARLRAKGSGFDSLVQEAEQELAKVDEEEAKEMVQPETALA
ncbi:hypothetical protein BABINDRAFT_159322 [Babjeviella inositovora NRRL Y-12698]|uniref:Mitochondrial inner membrane i-AAA protease supercomplex subunit MGR3 n=1 Tax=Babjeviella inositovora NRRL Y-12698 TaxID=984486 RepID=A0A1E3QYQ5_9ASCO|nr:uncharacterized protein BABINDRAFT_159322 [Babjeviella inositovora NRRL Y-12698]ODQ82819.1 hypothetical protein BABINDRAFT_159322 [Babjeviella inositovora NRRL Y-12698]